MDGDSVLADVMRAAESVSSASDAAPPPEPAPVQESAPAESASEPAPAPEATPRADRERRPDGKFAKKSESILVKPASPSPRAEKPSEAATQTPDADVEAGSPPTEKESQEPKPPADAARAPQSWKPAAREHWAKLPPEVQAEALRLDREVRQVMQESAPAKKLADTFQQTIAPYRALMTVEPMQAVANLLQTSATLQTGTVQEKAAVVASIIKNFGVPEEALVAALEGGHQQGGAPQRGGQPQYRDPRVDELFAQIQQAQQQRQMTTQAKTQKQVAEFAASHEFFEDVRDDMADLVDVAHRRGVELSWEDAYNRAVQFHPEIAGVLKQREAAKAATATQAATQRARDAASSVKSEPTGPVAPKSNRSALEEVKAQAARLAGSAGR